MTTPSWNLIMFVRRMQDRHYSIEEMMNESGKDKETIERCVLILKDPMEMRRSKIERAKMKRRTAPPTAQQRNDQRTARIMTMWRRGIPADIIAPKVELTEEQVLHIALADQALRFRKHRKD